MPITPSQAKRSVEEMYEDDWQYHYKRIDKHLAEGGRTVSIDDKSGALVDRIIKEYRAAGWDVQQVADFRDGPFLEFKEPRW